MNGKMNIKEMLGATIFTATLFLFGALCIIASGYHFE